jgi:hypothetical protein
MARKSKERKVVYNSRFTGEREVLGLDLLRNNLERDYFSKVHIRNSTVCCEQNNLVIELTCPLGLHEVLFHIQQGSWGTSGSCLVNKGISVLADYMRHIREVNQQFIDIEEFTITLTDCSIIIKKISQESVEYEIDSILNALAENYVYLTRHLSEVPMEIFIPIYEEVDTKDEIMGLLGPKTLVEKGYYSYWALYFESDDEAVIYDLKQKTIISGDLNLLNL